MEAESIATDEAFHAASGLTDEYDGLTMIFDCQHLLHGLKAGSGLPYLSLKEKLSTLSTYANLLYDLGISVELRWLPSHFAVEGNEQVNELGTRFRRSGQGIMAREFLDHIVSDVIVTAGSLSHFVRHS